MGNRVTQLPIYPSEFQQEDSNPMAKLDPADRDLYCVLGIAIGTYVRDDDDEEEQGTGWGFIPNEICKHLLQDQTELLERLKEAAAQWSDHPRCWWLGVNHATGSIHAVFEPSYFDENTDEGTENFDIPPEQIPWHKLFKE